MSQLSVFAENSFELPNKVLTHPEDISATLAEVGVRFLRWPLTPAPAGKADADELLAYCQPQLDQLMAEQSYAVQQVLKLDQQQLQEQAEWLQEQRCNGAELRFILLGSLQVNLHIEGYVYSLLCEAGDLLGLPAGCRQWLDCTAPVLAVRLGKDAAGLALHSSGDSIASRFARLEDFYSSGA